MEAAQEAGVAANSTLPGVADSTHAIQQPQPPTYTTLAETYSLDQLPEQEHQAYVTVPLSTVGTDALRFWEVHDLQW